MYLYPLLEHVSIYSLRIIIKSIFLAVFLFQNIISKPEILLLVTEIVNGHNNMVQLQRKKESFSF